MSATISDIAKAAGVSTATVSRMINKSGYVGEKSRIKIEEAIQALNYSPNAAAVSLSKKETKVIGVMVPEISNPFFSEILEGISQIADDEGYVVMVFDTGESMSREEKALKSIREQNLCGLLLTPVCDAIEDNPSFYKTLKSMKLPVVLMDREVEGLDVSGVYCDNLTSTKLLTKDLIHKGHNSIVCMAGDQSLKLGRDRLNGFIQAMVAQGHHKEDLSILYGSFDRQQAKEETLKLFKRASKPDAILSCNNIMTEGIIEALTELNLLGQVELASFDPLPWTQYIHLPLTYLERNTREMGRTCAKLLIEQVINKSNKSETIYIETKLVR